MTIRDRFFRELQQAISRGFTLAAVSVAMSCGTPSSPGSDAGVNADGGSGAMDQAARDVDGGQLGSAPSSFDCTGDAGNMGPYFGACCTKLHCYTPTTAECAASNSIGPHGTSQFTPTLPPGSGTCMCGTTQGPFAAADGGTAECCYVVGSIGCTGRPLREGEAAIVAAIVSRSDWA